MDGCCPGALTRLTGQERGNGVIYRTGAHNPSSTRQPRLVPAGARRSSPQPHPVLYLAAAWPVALSLPSAEEGERRVAGAGWMSRRL